MAGPVEIARKLRKALALSAVDRRLLIEAWLTLLSVRLRLSLHRLFRRSENLLARQGAPGMRPPAEAALPARLSKIVAIAARNHLSAMSCLPRALALRTMLARRGVESTLRIGVRKTPDGLEGHAWLEIDRCVVDDVPDVATRFVPLEGLDRPETVTWSPGGHSLRHPA